MTIYTEKTIRRVPSPYLSQLVIDIDKDWQGYKIKNLGAPVDAGDAIRKTDLDSHRTASPIDHPDGSITTAKIADGAVTTTKIADGNVTRAKLEYPTVNVPIAYLFIIGKAFQDCTDGNRFVFIGTLDNFADKMIANAQLMKAAESEYYEGFFGRAQADPRSDSYFTRVATGNTTADGTLEKVSAGTITSLGAEAVDLFDDTVYIFGISCSGSTIKRVRFDRWTVSAGAISFGTATVAVSATDTTFASGRFLERHTNVGGPDNPAGLVAFLLAPASPSPPAQAILELSVEGTGKPDDPFRPSMSRSLVEIDSLTGLPDFLYREVKKYNVLKAKGFTDDEMKLLFGYAPQRQVDLDSATWGAFEFHPDKASTVIITITGDNPYSPRAVERQKARAKRVFAPPKDYNEAVDLYNKLKADYPHWLAGKDNMAYQTLGWEVLDWFQNIDFYYGELIEHKTHYQQLKQVPDFEIRNRLNKLIEKLSKVSVLVEERDKHIAKAEEVLKGGW